MSSRWLALLLAALLAAPTAAQPGDDDEYVKARLGKFKVEQYGTQTRLIYDGTMIGTQFHDRAWRHPADVPNISGLFTQWEALAVGGAVFRWDPRAEPLSYYHRTGPVGALFWHLRTRKGGADALAPVGVVGTEAGTVAAYARPGQAMTFYTAHPETRELVAETDRWFTYIPDARKRGAKVEVRYGTPRKALAADPAKRFGLLLVEMVEDGFDPKDRLTLEAVQLYLDRTTPDGLIGLHVSNKYFKLEPCVDRIAKELGLAARVWNDDGGSRPGKTASSWVVLARTDADLGPFTRPLDEQILAYGAGSEAFTRLVRKYRWTKPAAEVLAEEYGVPLSGPGSLPPAELSNRVGPDEATLYRTAARALREQPDVELSLGRLADWLYLSMFHRLDAEPNTLLRTDAHHPEPPKRPPPPAPPPPPKG